MLHLYFMQAGVEGPIKIGIAEDPEERRRELQVGNAAELRLLAAIPGNPTLERVLHARYAAGRLRGEWFDPETPGLKNAIRGATQVEADVAVLGRICIHCGVRPVAPPRTRICSAECERDRKRHRSARWRREQAFRIPPNDQEDEL